ncbi:MAG: rhomboid family intramembrane serine protease [Candidatus Woesearchaeota archaeon]
MLNKSLVLPLILLNVVLFLIQSIFPEFVANWLLLISSEVLLKPWTLLTTAFLHGSVLHLAFNMIVLFFFAPLVEQRLGYKRFLLFYLVSAIFASFVAVFFYPAALGASGAVYALLGFVVILAPNLRVLLWGVLPMKLSTLIFILIFFDVFNTFSASNIATFAHFAGLSIGALYAFSLKKKVVRRKPKMTNSSSGIMMSDEEIEAYIRNRGF